MNRKITMTRVAVKGALVASAATLCLLLAPGAQAAVAGITGPTFALSAGADMTSQPDGAMIYTWGYGCAGTPSGFLPKPVTTPAPGAPATSVSSGPAATTLLANGGGICPAMQMPGPTLIVTEGQPVTVSLTNALPAAAGNTSIIFAGQNVTATGGVAGRLTQEATPGTTGTVTYTFTPTKPGTYAYYSGTQPELQIEMGMFGALVVLPASPPVNCKKGEYSLAASAYDNAATCYDREYLFQFSELNSRIHDAVKAQVDACPTAPCAPLVVATEPPHPNYFLINGRSMPDIQDTPYSPAVLNQPYNGNPHLHPGELMLMRVIGQGRIQHPFHFHGNHARVLGRDGNLMVASSDPTQLAGPLMFTTPTVSGQAVDQIFTWTGKGLNWDVYNHRAGDGSVCAPDANGYYTSASNPPAPANAPNYGEWCADHNKAIPVTPPDPNIVAIGQWYGGTPYLGLQTAPGSGFTPTTEPPGTLNQNPEAGYAYMWHSHDEREITTNDVFPGGMLMMLLIDPPSWYIDETL